MALFSVQYIFVIILLQTTKIALYNCQNINCNISFQCVGQSLVSTSNDVHGYGYKSISEQSTTITSNTGNPNGAVECLGAYSCFDIGAISANKKVQCMGSKSCSNGTIHIVANHGTRSLRCRGAESCKYAESLQSNTSVTCYGDQSCQYALIKSDTINAPGAYSLNYAKIDSENARTNLLSVSLSGYQAGFGAQITCRPSDNCYIECNGNACSMLYIDCSNNCVVNKTSANTISPITTLNDFNANSIHYFYSHSMESYNDILCETQSNSIKYDDYEEHRGLGNIVVNGNNDGPICCRGGFSCGDVNAITVDVSDYNINKHMIICSGWESCLSVGTILNKNGPIYCSGYNACDNAIIISETDNIYCTGSSSCTTCPQISALNVYCSAPSACYKSNITSNGNDINVYFIGQVSGWKARVFCNEGDQCNIVCVAKDSCLLTVAYCDGHCIVNCDEIEYNCPVIYSSNPTPQPTSQPTSLPTIQPSPQSTTGAPTTDTPTTAPTTDAPTTMEPTPVIPTTVTPTTDTPTTDVPTTDAPTTDTPTTMEPTSVSPSTGSPTTQSPSYLTSQPTTTLPTTLIPSTYPSNLATIEIIESSTTLLPALETITTSYRLTVQEKEGKEEALNSIFIIIGAITGGVFLLMCIVIIMLCKRNKSLKKATNTIVIKKALDGKQETTLTQKTDSAEFVAIKNVKHNKKTSNIIRVSSNDANDANDEREIEMMYHNNNKKVTKGQQIEQIVNIHDQMNNNNLVGNYIKELGSDIYHNNNAYNNGNQYKMDQDEEMYVNNNNSNGAFTITGGHDI